jgi:hypothetical protein
MYLPAMSHTLRRIRNTFIRPTCSLHALDAALVSPDTLEHFTLRLALVASSFETEILAGYRGWTVLDSIFTPTTTSSHFSGLRKVDVVIYANHNSHQLEGSDNIIQTCVSTRMPSLHEKSILAVDVVSRSLWTGTFLTET